ncbi:alpha-tocopherol transfer protein-like isoform X1 [Dinothrombium tinctorium]|uniref:Alpha-tocopherol transfer protein-like isoform X1 n=1 Tax=Dinothrombium tinctorium TaxID=1965070 RepID=A0A3S3QA64_9ACAR|nr:alpha-tocopherol transfer protein-like isoform X1 [Dinothrombium tinctorium]RWS06602.1 alpha-tocopherol transfer protein-like isoform X1 [Dinothrombium tinctorium]RWS10726.1 alpha-tocopherol transfer protein-like isoform X1 [Dinothrombium tinctorium]
MNAFHILSTEIIGCPVIFCVDKMDLNLIKEKEQNREKYTRALLERLKHEGIKQQFDDEFLVKFLRSRLYDVNKTCFAIKNYLTIFKKYPQFFTKIEFIKDAIEEEFFEMLPHRNITGETLCILRGGKWIPSKISLDKCVAATVYASEFDKLDEEAQINGSIEIIDLKDTGLRQFSKIATLFKLSSSNDFL